MIEQPKYELIKKQSPFELRRYQAFTMVEARDRDLESYQGFRLAFDFIQGENNKQQKIEAQTVFSLKSTLIFSLWAFSFSFHFVNIVTLVA